MVCKKWVIRSIFCVTTFPNVLFKQKVDISTKILNYHSLLPNYKYLKYYTYTHTLFFPSLRPMNSAKQ